MDNKNNDKIKPGKYVLSIAFMLALIVITYYFIFRNYELSSLIATLKTVDIRYIIVGVVFACIFISGNGLCIREIMKSLGCKFPISRAIIYSSIDFYYSAITPSATGGQPVMAYYMSKDGLPISKSSLAMVLTVMEYMLSLVILAIIAICCVPQFVFGAETIFIVLLIIGLLLATLLSLFCALAMFKGQWLAKPCKWLINVGAKLHIIKNKEKLINSGRETLGEYRNAASFMRHNPKVLIKVMTIAVLQRIALFAVSWCVYRSFGLTDASFVEIVAIQTLITTATTTIPLPGAVGVSEAIFILMYDHIYTDPNMRATAMVLTRVVSFYFCVLLCGGLTFYNSIRLMIKDARSKKHS